MTVLILTSDADLTADRVAAELALRGVPVVRLDPAEFPQRMSMSARISTGQGWSGDLTADSGDLVSLSAVRTVLHRRPTQFQMDERMSAPERAFAYGEARRGFGGVLTALAHCRWINDPAAAMRAEYKPVQLAAASDCGLTIPETLITSDPQAAHAWAKELARPIVYKPLSGLFHGDEGQVRALYTTAVDDPDDLLDPALARTAHLFQEQIPKEFEARAVVVAGKVFTVRIDAATDEAQADWRSDYDALTYAPIELSSAVATALVELHERLGLVYGAVDLIHDSAGRWVLLETNQRGEWGWLESETGAPIAEAFADLMETNE